MMLLFQTDLMPKDPTQPWLYVAGLLVAAIGALWLWTKSKDSQLIEVLKDPRLNDELRRQVARLEAANDKLSQDAGKQADVIRQLNDVVVRMTTMTETAFAATKANGEKLDHILGACDLLTNDHPSRRRGS